MEFDSKKFLKPREEFTEKTKTAFLAVFDVAHPEAVLAAGGLTNFAKALIAGGALAGVLAGMSVYADTANVAADNALYPLKRLDENVQLSFASQQEKAQLQATFAARRAAEIEDLTARKSTSTAITALDDDLNIAVDNSVADADRANLQDGNLDNFCGKVFSAIATSSLAMHGELSIHAKSFVRFKKICTGGGAASSTPAPTSTAPFPPFTKHLHIRGGGELNIIFGHAPSTAEPQTPGENLNQSLTGAVTVTTSSQNENNSGFGNNGEVSASTTIFFPGIQRELNLREKGKQNLEANIIEN